MSELNFGPSESNTNIIVFKLNLRIEQTAHIILRNTTHKDETIRILTSSIILKRYNIENNRITFHLISELLYFLFTFIYILHI